MPKKTFFNLSDIQKNSIIDNALKEFSEHDFNSASLNNIINSLDVTKGSFYRYFESKKELYDFLVAYASDKKLTFMKNSIDTECKDFFEQFKSIMYSFLSFDLCFPTYGKFLLNLEHYNNLSKKKVNYSKIEDYLKEMIEYALQTGTLSHEFDVDFIYHCMIKVTEGLENYISELTGSDREKLISMSPSVDIGSDKELEEIFNKAINFLKHGFGTR